MEEINLRDLQLAELDILKEFIRVCNDLKLTYFLDCGTLLGCIRHKGFIPWDDDIDVCMPREDYEIFIKNGQKLLQEKYFIQNYHTEPEYTLGYSKIRNSDTTFIETSVKKHRINHGVYIDIFPLDGYRPQNKIRNIKDNFVRKAYIIYCGRNYCFDKTKKSFKRSLVERISKVMCNGKTNSEVLTKIDKIAQKYRYNDSEYVCSYCDNNIVSPDEYYIPREYLGKGIIKEFEGMEVMVPEKYDVYLKRKYNNYMELPPKEKQVAHHYNMIIDLNKSYKEYMTDIR